MKKFIERHYLGFISSIIVGLLILLPQILLIAKAGEDFEDVLITNIDNDHFYLSKISSVVEGDYKISRDAMYVDESMPYTNSQGAEIVIGAIARFLGLEMPTVILVGQFLFPALITLFIYLCVFQFSRSRLLALAVSACIVLASSLLAHPQNLLYFFSNWDSLWHNTYNRPIHPQFSSLTFFVWLYVFLKWLETRSIKLLIATGILFGGMFYVYPYTWTFTITILGIFTVWTFFKNGIRSTLWYLSIIGMGLLVAIPFWLNYLELAQHPLFETMRLRFVIFISHTPIWSNLLFVSLVAIGIYFWQKGKDRAAGLLLALTIAGWIVINQQVITGIRMFPGHWHWYYIIPTVTIVLLTVLYFLLGRVPRFRKILFSSSIIFFLVFGTATQIAYANRSMDRYVGLQRYGNVYNWLEENAEAGSVVLSNDAFAEYLPVYTSHFRYAYHSVDATYLIPTERLLHTHFVRLRAKGVSESEVEEYLNQQSPEFRELLFGYYRYYTQGCWECYPEEQVLAIQNTYKEFLQQDYEKELKEYKIDYIVVDTKNQEFIDFGQFNFTEKVAEIEDIIVYKVI